MGFTYLLDINVIIQQWELEKGVREARRWDWCTKGGRLEERGEVGVLAAGMGAEGLRTEREWGSTKGEGL